MALTFPQDSAETSKTRSWRNAGVWYGFFGPRAGACLDKCLLVMPIPFPFLYCKADWVNLITHPTPVVALQGEVATALVPSVK